MKFKKLNVFLNEKFLIGLFIGLLVGSLLMESSYLYFNKDTSSNHKGDFKQKSLNLTEFVDDYKKILEKTAENSADDLEKLLCLKLYLASASYLEEIGESFQQINKLKDPDKTMENLEELLDRLRKEREELENKNKVKI